MDLGLYFIVLWRRRWVIVAAIVAVLAVVSIGDWRTPHTYESTALVRVSLSAKASQSPTLYNYSDELMSTFVRVANSSSVRAEWMQKLGASDQPQVTLEAVSGTELVRVTVTHPNRAFAAKAANAYADLLVERGRQFFLGSEVSTVAVLDGQLERSLTDLNDVRVDYEHLLIQTPAAVEKIAVIGQSLQEKQRTYEALLRQMEQAQLREALESDMISIVERAIPAAVQSQNFTTTLYIVATLAALVFGVMLAFVFERIDTTLYASKEIESTAQAHVLAKLPKTAGNHLYISKNGISPLAESVRHLAARFQLANADAAHKCIALTGSEMGQGVTTTTANLGVALAEQGKQVVLVDLNLRDPGLYKLFDLSNDKGITDILNAKLKLDDVLQTARDGKLALLSSGPAPDSAFQALDNARMESILKTLRQRFDYVVLDVPPVDMANIVSIAPYMDELILVTRRSHVRREPLRTAGEFLSSFKDKYIGLIVNEAEAQGMYALT